MESVINDAVMNDPRYDNMGQHAYEMYCQTLGGVTPGWADLPIDMKTAWTLAIKVCMSETVHETARQLLSMIYGRNVDHGMLSVDPDADVDPMAPTVKPSDLADYPATVLEFQPAFHGENNAPQTR